jgi:hypothetical protein
MQRITEDTVLFSWTERDLEKEAHALIVRGIAEDEDMPGDVEPVGIHPAGETAAAFRATTDSVMLQIEEAFERTALALYPGSISADSVTGGQNVRRVTAVRDDGARSDGALVTIQVWVPWGELPDNCVAL